VANRSLDWPSGVMNPKPLSSLNHWTVPVAQCPRPGRCYGVPIRLGRPPDEGSAGGRSRCLKQSPRSQHATTQEEAQCPSGEGFGSAERTPPGLDRAILPRRV
jgi:hypothetical protein